MKEEWVIEEHLVKGNVELVSVSVRFFPESLLGLGIFVFVYVMCRNRRSHR